MSAATPVTGPWAAASGLGVDLMAGLTVALARLLPQCLEAMAAEPARPSGTDHS